MASEHKEQSLSVLRSVESPFVPIVLIQWRKMPMQMEEHGEHAPSQRELLIRSMGN